MQAHPNRGHPVTTLSNAVPIAMTGRAARWRFIVFGSPVVTGSVLAPALKRLRTSQPSGNGEVVNVAERSLKMLWLQ
jgi:hypothetical protein